MNTNVHRVVAAVLLTCTLGVGCPAEGEDSSHRVEYKEARIISAYPAREQSGQWEAVCDGGEVDGFLLNVAFVSHDPHDSSDDPDRDLSIRPGDYVGGDFVEPGGSGTVDPTAINAVEIELACVDPLPDVDNLAALTVATCQGATQSGFVDEGSYVEHSAERRGGHNVVVLVDESGSMKGLVNDGDWLEGQPGTISLTSDFLQVASDYNQVRHGAIQRLLAELNSEDRVAVLGFGEGLNSDGLEVPCTAATGSVYDDLETCFGTNRDLWTIQSLITGQGRSNLWEAVGEAWDFLGFVDDAARTNHVVVVTDGPDTCAVGAGLASCQLPCSVNDFQTVRERIEQGAGVPIHIHFVQFESKGYRGRDARQVEVACRTGGHYQFINSVDFNAQSPWVFEDALNTALDQVRFALMGSWQFAVMAPGFAGDWSPPDGSPPGSLYGVQGTFRVMEAAGLDSIGHYYEFGVGEGLGASDATNWDRRRSR